MPYEQFLIPAISSIISVFVGLFVGRHLSDRKEKQKNDEELEKIKDLIVRDLRTIRRLTNESLAEQKKDLEYLLDGKGKSSGSHYLLQPHVYFPYWPTLVNSGALLKLKPYEILTVQSVHDKIMDLYETQKNILDNHLKKLSSESDSNKKNNMYIDLHKLSTDFHKTILQMLDMITVEWITFDKSKDVVKDTNLIHNEPFVTENGITVYPDGTKVDSHGTIL